MSVLITGGTVVTPRGSAAASVRIEGETIAEVGALEALPGEQIVDAAGCLILPGGIDSHTHLELDCGPGLRTIDDWASGTRSALAGGTTMMVDFATQFHGQAPLEGLAHWHAMADGHAVSDYAFHLAFTEWKPEFAAELPALVDAGVTSFKMYMGYYGSMMVTDDQILQALRAGRELGVTFGFHCENGTIIAARVAEELAAGHTASWYHQRTRPEASEWEAAYRLGFVAETADAPVYVVHVSSAGTMDVVREYRARGVRYAAETCPQYLVADNSEYGTEPPGGVASPEAERHARKFMMSPPLRDASNNDRLWTLLADGDIHFVGTDHCSFTLDDQKARASAFNQVANGAPGIELRLPLLWTYGVVPGKITPERFAAVTAENAARYFGMFPRKGVVAPGSDADLVLFDPARTWTVRHAAMHDAGDYSQYEGRELTGKVRDVFLRGRQVVVDGEPLPDLAPGRYVPRGRPEWGVR